MSIESLVALKDRYKYNGRPNFGTEVLNILVDEIVALDEKIVALNEKIDGLDEKIDGLDEKIDGLHP